MALLTHLQKADLRLLLPAALLPFVIYAVKAVRFQKITEYAGCQLPYRDAWRIFTLGVLFAMVTPGKIGELGRAAYLRDAGLSTKNAIAVAILDRVFDVLFVAIAGMLSVWLLFPTFLLSYSPTLLLPYSPTPLLPYSPTLLLSYSPTFLLVGIAIATLLWCIIKRNNLFAETRTLISPTLALFAFAVTACAWAVHFLWAILIARSIGIEASIPILMAALTVASAASLLPIAPSGLGTRDAALLTLLAPYGVSAPLAVSLALLMFTSIIFSGIAGMWYWVRKSTV